MYEVRLRMVRVPLAAAICVLVAACVSPEELRRQDESTCAGYGFHPGTDAFSACLQQESPCAPLFDVAGAILGRILGTILALGGTRVAAVDW
jgi:hypothetical protein